MDNVKSILSEHGLYDAGGGNNIKGSSSEPSEDNFEGKIWYNTTTQEVFVYYDGKYRPTSGGGSLYLGKKRTLKDEGGTFEVVEHLDKKGNVLHRSTLSSPDDKGKYQNRKLEYNVGTSSLIVLVFKLTYDDDGDLIEEKLVSMNS